MTNELKKIPTKLDLADSAASIGLSAFAISNLDPTTGLAAASASLAQGYRLVREGFKVLEYFQTVKMLIQSGKVKKEKIESEEHKDLLDEYLHLLETEPVSREKTRILQSILLATLAGDITSQETNPQLLMNIAKTLDTGEVILLFELYRLYKKPISKAEQEIIKSARGWLSFVSQNTSMTNSDLVEISEEKLMQKGFITKRLYPDGSGVIAGPNLRLTSLAILFCEFVEKGNNLSKAS